MDSLVTGDFSKKERKTINDKIEEFSLLEKQLETDVYRQKFHKEELKDQLLNLDPFKEAILRFKLNQDSMTEKEFQGWLKENIERITLDQNNIKIIFKKLPFELE